MMLTATTKDDKDYMVDLLHLLAFEQMNWKHSGCGGSVQLYPGPRQAFCFKCDRALVKGDGVEGTPPEVDYNAQIPPI